MKAVAWIWIVIAGLAVFGAFSDAIGTTTLGLLLLVQMGLGLALAIKVLKGS
jgi:hypothetical protein